MEIIGQEYFDHLATRSFFQEFDKDDEGTVIRCKVHDIVHDFAQHLTKNECFSAEVDDPEESLSLINSFQEKLHHLMSVVGNHASFPISILNARKLLSFLINCPFEVFSPVLQGAFDQLTCLRALRIVGMNNWVIYSTNQTLKGIEKLLHLRYLKFFQIGIEELPETCCGLFNLQTLEIEECRRLKRLPQGMGNLVNVKHLRSNDYHLDYIPKGIERLTSLRTLSSFVVSHVGKYSSKACNLEGLRHLNHLRGSLRIRWLGCITGVEEARIGDLEKEKNLLYLELGFDKKQEDEGNHETISEALRPPPNLVSLEILDCEGKTGFPSWVGSLNKLKKLLLKYCNNCEVMPPLGNLPSPGILQIINMRSVKRVGDEFLGIENAVGKSSSSSSIAFPKLKELTLWNLHGWDFGTEDVTIMPQLNSLDIRDCSKLKLLPNQLLRSITLEYLDIYGCPILEERFKKYTGEDWSMISHIPNIQINYRYVQGQRRPRQSR